MSGKSPWLFFPNNKKFSLEWLQEHERIEQQQLKQVFDDDERVHCLCKSKKDDDPFDAPQLYVSHRHGKLSLSRMPNTGSEHAHWCPFYGQAAHDDKQEERSFAKSIKARFSLELDASNAIKADLDIAPKSDEMESNDLSIGQVLNLIWKRSGNHRFFAGHPRNWDRVRYFVLKACEQIEINGTKLLDRLFVPKQYDKAKQDAQNEQFWQWHDSLTIHPEQGELGLLLAQIRVGKDDIEAVLSNKRLENRPYLSCDNLPMRLMLSHRAVKQIRRGYEVGVDNALSEENKLVGLFLVGRTKAKIGDKERQVLMAYQGMIMLVDQNYVPLYPINNHGKTTQF
jgi:hypothetical protein